MNSEMTMMVVVMMMTVMVVFLGSLQFLIHGSPSKN
jgi:hypothetical protein